MGNAFIHYSSGGSVIGAGLVPVHWVTQLLGSVFGGGLDMIECKQANGGVECTVTGFRVESCYDLGGARVWFRVSTRYSGGGHFAGPATGTMAASGAAVLSSHTRAGIPRQALQRSSVCPYGSRDAGYN